MKLIKIKLHSSVDLITNSSTVIFTYSNGSVEPLKELVNEMLVVFGEGDKKFDDIFGCAVFLDDDSYYLDSDDFPTYDTSLYSNDKSYFETLCENIVLGKQEKPQWMINIEDDEDDRDTSLFILSKDKKYDGLANKLINFLYSTNHDGRYE